MVAVTLAVGTPSFGQPSGLSSSPLQASDLLRMQTVQEAAISPSGRNVAFTVRRGGGNGTAHRPQLYVASTSGRTAPRRLTRDPRGASQPAWGPDGTWITFVRPVDGTPQLFILSLNGGEAYQLTDAPHGATHPKWGPQGEQILFASTRSAAVVRTHSSRVPPSTRPGRTRSDTIRSVPPDTLLILRERSTFDPVDTLQLGPEGIRHPTDTTVTLRTSANSTVPDTLRDLSVDSLRALSTDSLRTVFETLHVRPDTTLRPVNPDTAASPDGDLLQIRRWLHQSPSTVYTAHSRTSPGSEAGDSLYRHYFVVDVPDNLTQSPDSPAPGHAVAEGYRSYGKAAWLPGGDQIVVSAPPSSPVDSDSVSERSLYVVDLNQQDIHRLLHIDGRSLSRPRVTPDGTTLAFRVRATEPSTYAQSQIGIFSLDGTSDPEIITDAFDYDVSSFRWSPDGWFLYATARAGMGRPIYRLAPFAQTDTSTNGRGPSLAADREVARDSFALDSTMIRTAAHTRVLDTSRWVTTFDVTDATVVYGVVDEETPSELFANTVSFANERQLSTLNNWRTERPLAPTAQVMAQNDSLKIYGRFTHPVNAVDSLQYPLVVVPQGGPSLLDSPSPSYAWFERQYLAARGYAVIEVWPRGSNGFGNAFRRSNRRDWGAGPMRDVLAVVDSVADRQWIDETRTGVAGHGYGATLAVWTAAHSDQFDAAVAHNGIYEFSSLLERGRGRRLLQDQFGGYPWEGALSDRRQPFPYASSWTETDSLSTADPRLPISPMPSPSRTLRRNAPLTYAEGIRTPLLLSTTPESSSARVSTRALYRRVRTMNKPIEYVQYPASTPAQRREHVVRLYEFLARFLAPGPSTSDRLPSE